MTLLTSCARPCGARVTIASLLGGSRVGIIQGGFLPMMIYHSLSYVYIYINTPTSCLPLLHTTQTRYEVICTSEEEGFCLLCGPEGNLVQLLIAVFEFYNIFRGSFCMGSGVDVWSTGCTERSSALIEGTHTNKSLLHCVVLLCSSY